MASPHRSATLRRVAALLVLAALTTTLSRAGAESPPPQEGSWYDADGRPLPFSTDAELLAFLRTAPVVGSKQLSGGINNPHRLDLGLPGYRVRAIFRDVDVTRRSGSSAADRRFPSFRDSYVFEVAAYELSRLLGLDNVPPVVLYEWQGRPGSLQLWVENASTEGERMAERRRPEDPAGWHRQQTSMVVFDNLIFNFDRNHGNQLLDEHGKLWFIDHTRSFKHQTSLPYRDRLLVVDAGLWNRLESLDEETVRDTLEPYLDVVQIGALLKRRRLLVRYIASMIEERGEDQVLLGGAAGP